MYIAIYKIHMQANFQRPVTKAMAIAPELRKVMAKSTKCETIRLSKTECNLFGRKPVAIIGKTRHKGIVWYIVRLAKNKAAVLLKHEIVVKKYPRLLKKEFCS